MSTDSQYSPESDVPRHSVDQLMDAQREVDDILDEDNDCELEYDQLRDDMAPASSSPDVSSPASATPTDDGDGDNNLLCVSHPGTGCQVLYASCEPNDSLTVVDRPEDSYFGGAVRSPRHEHEQENEAKSPELLSEDMLYPFEQSPFIPRLHELLLLAQRDQTRGHLRRYTSVESNTYRETSASTNNTNGADSMSTSDSYVVDSVVTGIGLSGAFGCPTSGSRHPVSTLRSIVPVSGSRRLVSGLRPVVHNSTLAICGCSEIDTSPQTSSTSVTIFKPTPCDSHWTTDIRRDNNHKENVPAIEIPYTKASAASSSPLSQTQQCGTIYHGSRATLKRRYSEIPDQDAYTPSKNRAYTPKGCAYGPILALNVAISEERKCKKRKLGLRRKLSSVCDSKLLVHRRSTYIRRAPSDTKSGTPSESIGPGILPNVRKYARESASLRRAASLRSEASAGSEDGSIIDAENYLDSLDVTPRPATQYSNIHSLIRGSAQTDVDYISAEPSTPLPLTHDLTRGAISPFQAPELALKATRVSRSDSIFKVRQPAPRASSPPVPIIAPPVFADIPRAPLNREDAAEARLKVMLEKEDKERIEDGLASRFPFSCEMIGATITVSGLICVNAGNSAAECDCEECVDNEELDENEDEDEEDEYSDQEVDDVGVDGESTDRSQPDVELNAGIRKVLKTEDARVGALEDEFRREVVAWLLDVIPPLYPAKRHICAELRDQLVSSPDTRFHAALFFLRYFFRLGSSPTQSPSCSDNEQLLQNREGRRAIIWDVAMACLTVSVKLHRDFLAPLAPSYASEFLLLAPHKISYDDLEAAQWDILEGFSFCLGNNTPEAYMQELWDALPGLRALLGFERGWQMARTETWETLFDVICDSAVLRFPVSMLTGCALIKGTIEALASKYVNDSLHTTPKSQRGDQFRVQAAMTTQSVICDIQEVLGISRADMDVCRDYLDALGGE